MVNILFTPLFRAVEGMSEEASKAGVSEEASKVGDREFFGLILHEQ